MGIENVEEDEEEDTSNSESESYRDTDGKNDVSQRNLSKINQRGRKRFIMKR